MDDISHLWGADLAVGPTGDLAPASGAARGQQRVLRRLLTNPGDYLWQPGYGAGLGQFVGSAGGEMRIRAAIRGQIFKEDAVARTPEPMIDVQFTPDGSVYVQIRYADAASGEVQILVFTVGA